MQQRSPAHAGAYSLWAASKPAPPNAVFQMGNIAKGGAPNAVCTFSELGIIIAPVSGFDETMVADLQRMLGQVEVSATVGTEVYQLGLLGDFAMYVTSFDVHQTVATSRVLPLDPGVRRKTIPPMLVSPDTSVILSFAAMSPDGYTQATIGVGVDLFISLAGTREANQAVAPQIADRAVNLGMVPRGTVSTGNSCKL